MLNVKYILSFSKAFYKAIASRLTLLSPIILSFFKPSCFLLSIQSVHPNLIFALKHFFFFRYVSHHSNLSFSELHVVLDRTLHFN